LRNCAIETGIRNLELISGAQDSVDIANLGREDREKLVQAVWRLNSQFVIVDLGAGTSNNTLDFFNAAHLGIIVLLPEPTSIENAYRFIKSCYYRRLFTDPRLMPVRDLIEMAMDGRNASGIRTPADLLKAISQRSPELQETFLQVISGFRFKILLNQARTQADTDMGNSVRTICKKYFGINVDYLGSIDYDSCVWQAVRRKRPTFTEFPNSSLVSTIDRMTMQLLKSKG
jgi:flagellar biosynthesis protein FlhG